MRLPLHVKINEPAVNVYDIDVVPVITQVILETCESQLEQIVKHSHSTTANHNHYKFLLIFEVLVQVNFVDVNYENQKVNGMDRSKENMEVRGVRVPLMLYDQLYWLSFEDIDVFSLSKNIHN